MADQHMHSGHAEPTAEQEYLNEIALNLGNLQTNLIVTQARHRELQRQHANLESEFERLISILSERESEIARLTAFVAEHDADADAHLGVASFEDGLDPEPDDDTEAEA